MYNKYTLSGKVENGKMVFDDKLAVLVAFGRFEGKEVNISIQEKGDWKTELQNNYWWGVLIPDAQRGFWDLGYKGITAKQVYAWLIQELMTEPMIDKSTGDAIINKKTGEIMTEVRTLSKITTKREMMSLIDRAILWCAENLFIRVREPDPFWMKNKKS